MPVYDTHGNFGYSTVATAPSPATSGTTLSVTTGHGSRFPAITFNAVVWPAGAAPLASNAEIVRVTNKGTGDNWTITRQQESSSARSIAVGDQIMLAVTAKMFTDIEAQVDGRTGPRMHPGGRLTLTTAVPVTTADVTAATTLYYTPYTGTGLELYDVATTSWLPYNTSEISIAIPATTSTMYDVFIYSSSGTPTLELLAWSSDTARATALVRQNGRLVKTGATDRLYLGSVRTTGSSGQTEDSFAKRYVWNYYNRVERTLRVVDATNTWDSHADAWVQANASAANQIDIVVGVAEVALRVNVLGLSDTSVATKIQASGIGEDSATVLATGCINDFKLCFGTSVKMTTLASLLKYPAVGRHYYTWLNYGESGGGNACHWYGDNGLTVVQTGISGSYWG